MNPAADNAAWRDPAQIIGWWDGAGRVDPKTLRCQVEGDWWGALASTHATLLLTREYEHLVIAMTVRDGRPHSSYLHSPHPSGLVVDRDHQRVHIASTRNPNQIVTLQPIANSAQPEPVLAPTSSHFLPGRSYLHDLALMDGRLIGNAVGRNAVVSLPDAEARWWPQCVEREGALCDDRNYLQLNGIAAGADFANSYFSASTDHMSTRRPGHLNFAVDGRGVIFSGASREPCVRGLTRPHSPRLHAGQLWVDNSGYGEVGIAVDGRLEVVRRLPGWTRGLGFCGNYAFVSTSRVLPRFRHYAPGLEVNKSRCGVHAIELSSGRVVGSIYWPAGNQIFAIDWLPRTVAVGFPFAVGQPAPARMRKLFFDYTGES
jgi:uncharacterized protein (TIGR03032 family)